MPVSSPAGLRHGVNHAYVRTLCAMLPHTALGPFYFLKDEYCTTVSGCRNAWSYKTHFVEHSATHAKARMVNTMPKHKYQGRIHNIRIPLCW
jgi:hypothetical protein